MAAGNEVTLIGNVTSDPELKFLPSGAAVATFGLAWNRRFQQDGEWQEEPHFFDVTVWREMAENVTESFRKGDRVVVVGRLEQSRWEDKATGDKRSKVGVTADEVAASIRWATVEITKVSRDEQQQPSRGRSGGSNDRGRDRGDGGRRDGGGGRGRSQQYEDDPF